MENEKAANILEIANRIANLGLWIQGYYGSMYG